MDLLFQDIAFGARALRRRPSFTLVAAAMLALGIGANTAIFSVLHKVVLAPLPYERPSELYYIGADRDGGFLSLSAPEFLALRDAGHSFEAIATWDEVNLNLVGEGDPERVSSARITTNLLSLLGVTPALGRGFSEEEAVDGRDGVVLLSAGAFRRRFGGKRDALGRQLNLNGRSYTIVGVLPEDFSFPSPEVELYVPFVFSQDELDNPGMHYLLAVGRAGSDVSPEVAREDTTGVLERATAGFAEGHRGVHGARVAPMQEYLLRDHRAGLFILTTAVALVLLIVCANVANLLLARAAERRRELAVRAAMGAGRLRLVRQLLTESFLLALLGGGGGFLFALWGIDLIVRLSPRDLPRLETIGMDGTVFAFVAAISLASAILFGLLPALRASRSDLERALHETARGDVSSSTSDSSRNVLVAGEIAVALVLLVGAGLTIRSFWELGRVRPGFESANLLTAQLVLPESRYPKGAQQTAFVRRMLGEVRAIPGVRSASVGTPIPMSGSRWRLSVEFLDREGASGEPMGADWRSVTPGYFATMGIPLVAGRDFSESDVSAEASPEPERSVVVVNRSFARKFFPDEDPLGKHVRIGYNDIDCEIVGVVGDVRGRGLAMAPGEEMYSLFDVTPLPNLGLVLRSQSPPENLSRLVREAVWRVDPEQPVYGIDAMPELVARSVTSQRFLMTLLGSFAFVALTLAALGIYAVVSYSVVQRTREIGIRMALGARRREVLELVLGKGARLFVAGAVVGLAGALALSRFLASQLFGIATTDLATYVGVALLLLLVAILAAALPTHRASRLDPLAALRHE